MTNELETTMEKNITDALAAEFKLKPSALSTEFKPKAVEISIDRFIENGERLYEKQLKVVGDLQLHIQRERAEIVNKTREAMIALKNKAEKELFEFDQLSADKLANAERMLRALDAMRRTR